MITTSNHGTSAEDKVAVFAPSTASKEADGSESREVIQARIRNSMAVVDRWFDSDDSVPWSAPTAKDEVRLKAGPQSMRPEIARNEERLQITTARIGCLRIFIDLRGIL